MFKITEQSKGFTMMEIMIYVALVVTAMVVLSRFTVDVVQNAARSRIVKEVELNAQLTLNRLAQEVRHAQSIVVTGNQLILLDVNNNSVIVQYNATDKKVERIWAGNTESITVPGVRVMALSFSPIQASGITKGVTVEITVAQGPVNVPPIYRHQADLATTAFARQLLY